MNSVRAVTSSRATQDVLRGILLLGGLAAFGFAQAMLPLAAAAGMTLGALIFLLVLAQPLAGLLLLVLAIPFGSPFNVQVGGFNLGPTELIFALTLAAWLGRKVTQREVPRVESSRVGIPNIVFASAALLFAFALTLTVTHSLPESLKELIKWFEVLALTLFMARSLKREHVAGLLVLLFVAAALESGIGLYQTYTRSGPDPFFVPLGNQIIMRSYGTFEQPNPFAAYLNYALTMITSLLIAFVFEKGKFADRHERTTNQSFPTISSNFLLTIALLCLPLIATAFFFSLSRGAWLGYAVAFVVMVAFRSRRAFILFGLLALVSLGVLVLGSLNILPPAISERLTDLPTFLGLNLFDPRAVVLTNENFALVDRMAHWYAAWNMFVDHPWLGVGIGNYGVAYAQYGFREWPLSLGHAHNFYLNLLAETGIIGAAFYALFVCASIGFAWLTVQRTHGLSQAVAMGMFGAIIAITVHNIFDNLWVHGMNMQFAMLLGTLAVLQDRSSTTLR